MKTKVNISQDDYDRWIVTLRSGSMRQGQGALADRNVVGEIVHCCLGVLGEIVGERVDSGTVIHFKFGEDVAGGYIPLEYIPWEEQKTLAYMNDHGSNFLEIADWIENNTEPVDE